MDADKSTFSEDLAKFHELTSRPEIFLEQAGAEAKGFQNVSKKLYQISILANSLTHLKANSLPQLLVDGFDQEQIWQQVELQNKSATLHFSNNLHKFESCIPNFDLKIEDAPTRSVTFDQDDLSEDQSLSDDYQDRLSDASNESNDDGVVGVEDDISNEVRKIEKPKSILKKSVKRDVPKLDEDEESSTVDQSEKTPKRRKYMTKVDDQFFKLSKLEQFLRVEDLKEERARDGNLNEAEESDDEDEELSSDEDIDLFQDIPSDDEDDDVQEDEEAGIQEDEDEIMKTSTKSSRELMYEDFFDAPDSGDENANENETSDQEQNDDLSASEIDVNKDEGDSEDDAGDLLTESVSDKDSQLKPKTPFELEQEQTRQQILEYEEKMLKPAAWHLTGEVDSSARPVDALLHLQTDFDMNAKPVVIQDKPLCEKLENMLKTTIKNKSFSDGVKQYKTNDEIIAKKKEIVIEQTKSKKSLAQEYEDMYLKKKHGEGEEENPKHAEINKFINSLYPELYALFSHIPKPAIPDIKIVSNLPAILMEEVAPTSVSDVTLLAPEEVKKRTGIVKGKTERTDVERKQERRKKKFHQKMKHKPEKADLMKKVSQQRNTKFAKTDGQKTKSSKDFFEKLQEITSSTVSKTRAKKKG